MGQKNGNVEQFCKANAREFAAWSNAEAVDILRNGLAIAALLTFTGF